MKEGQETASPVSGGAGAAHAPASLARAAESLVRAGNGTSFAWRDWTVRTLFQPIYCVRRRACLGFEALAGVHDARGVLQPCEQFFDGERHEGRGLLDWACRALHLRTFATVDPGDRSLFINVHPEAALRDTGHAHDLAALIRYYGLSPRRVCIEILEAPCSDEQQLVAAVQAYRDLGVSIAMDDFGVGASDFARVKRIRPDMVKIDKTLAGGPLGQVVDALHAAGARVAIEGVDSRAGAAAALRAGADYLQGFYFAEPAMGLEGELLGRELLERLLHEARAAA